MVAGMTYYPTRLNTDMGEEEGREGGEGREEGRNT